MHGSVVRVRTTPSNRMKFHNTERARRQAARQQTVESYSTAFPAKYLSSCSVCWSPIDIGQPIVRESTGRYLHDGCRVITRPVGS